MESHGVSVVALASVYSEKMCLKKCMMIMIITRKMVPISGRARSFLLFLEFYNREEGGGGGQNKENRPINLPKVITFSTVYKYTTYPYIIICNRI